ncbi:MAG: ATP-binding protein [Saprospiraceae bacterium]
MLSFKSIPYRILRFIRHILYIRQGIPVELEREFIEFKDIKSIDRIQTSAWIGIVLTFFTFGLDFFRMYKGIFWDDKWYPKLFLFHLSGLLFIIPAIHISLHKKWIIERRLRRGIVIWGMVILTSVFLLGQAVLTYLQRDSLVLFIGYIFVASWMFAMSNKERFIFNFCTISIMAVVIFHFKENVMIIDSKEVPAMTEDKFMNMKLTNFIEIFFLSVIAFFFDSYDFDLKLETFMNRREIEREKERIVKLESFKSRFFTNLTHEIRTPLTLISGMAREISEDPKRWAIEGAEIISRNSGNLLNLINQILDLSKIENGSLEVKMIRGDIVSYLGYVVDAFKGHAYAKKIQLHFLSDEEEIIMDIDPDKYLTILSNLLSNAIKFTPEGGNIYVQLNVHRSETGALLDIAVRDSGIGISQESLSHIFERFYQADNNGKIKGIGTGIGLSVVSELVKLLNGEIKVKSNIDKGTQFNLVIPITTQAEFLPVSIPKERISREVKDFYTPVNADVVDEIMMDAEEKPEVLIIEDNQDVMKFLQVCLGDLFQLSFAHDGQEGIKKAIETVPDLILSDVMMPVKDGLAVCRELKLNQITSHIPIVLLSAKADLESRVAGLESGADVYMLKPFDKRELRAQLGSLLEKQREHQARYANPVVPLEVAEDDIKAKEDEFVVRVRNVILEHLDNAEFGVMQLCRAVFLSRTQLHKKLKALTGQPASLFIRQIRLYSALNLLKTSDLNINEIAYQVGFDDPNYFSRCFSQEFGTPPSETRK